ncbi:MAG: [FeFe] hydrogenase H-cluster radical SAM maturase HydE, partial [Armatimonadetes bacterium]|nr:[FeFe] hydrogenase H-cluster radical SAM maturase HydE [Armatimonadota bacterium]
ELRGEADSVRRRTVGDEVHLRGIIEFSNYCRCHCMYCGLRAENQALRRYRMRAEEIVQAAEEAERLGLGTVVLQSGEDLAWTAEGLAEVVAQIKSRTSLAVTLSVGERETWEYRLWREAGADRYLLKHETSDPALYARLHPGASFENRLRCLETLFELGYQVGSGCIVGLPGQTPRSLAQDLLLLQRLGVHMAGIGPLIPHPQTPLAAMPVGPAEITLNMLALTRLLIPDVMLAATTALETAMPGGRLAGLRAGANVIMPNITPRQYASFYEIYPGRTGARLAEADEVGKALQVIAAAGRKPAHGPGHSPRLVVCGGGIGVATV